MIKKLIITIGGLVVLLGLIIGSYAGMIMHLIAAGANQTVPAEPVTTAVAKADHWSLSLGSTGTLTAVQGVTVSAQLDGTVAALHFEGGSAVKAGDLLVQMDVGPEQAQLTAAAATVELTRLNLGRSKELLEQNTISQAQLDADDAAFKSAEAQAENIRATIAKKTLRAPFAGQLGVRLVNLGQTLKAGDAIVSLQALNPIFVDFYLPQQDLAKVTPGMGVKVTSNAFPDHPGEGKITTINPDVDASTRNVRVQATLDNADGRMRPGMFVEVDAQLPAARDVLIIPATAVLYAPFGDSVFVIEDQKDATTGAVTKVARQKFIRLGLTRGDFVAVDSGLDAGALVVTSGVFKLHNGSTVTLDNTLAPDAQLDPKPNDT
jgi:membrane fusion protein (multidrug efflux system)